MIRSVAGLVSKVSHSVSHTVRHPLATTSYAVGLARGLAAEGIRLASGGEREREQEQVRTAVEPASPQRVPLQPGERHEAEVAAARDIPEPDLSPIPTPGEVFANEPHAASRDSAHGDGPIDDIDVDRWQEDAEDVLAGEDVAPVPPSDEPLLDPSVAKQVRSEAETMQRGASTSID